ncbi:MAG: hypothetical protein ACP5RM_00465 [Candidatus Micrarchaeia archaeon]
MIWVLGVIGRASMVLGSSMMIASIFTGLFSMLGQKATDLSRDLYYGAIVAIVLSIVGIILGARYV